MQARHLRGHVRRRVAVPDERAAGQVAFITARGLHAAIHAATQDGNTPTPAEQAWIEVGVAWGLLAALETLTECGWITGPG
jgi:hypothetical protein